MNYNGLKVSRSALMAVKASAHSEPHIAKNCPNGKKKKTPPSDDAEEEEKDE